MKLFATAVLLAAATVLVAQPAAGQEQQQNKQPESRQIKVTILGMSCPFCAYGVEQKLKKLDGVEKLEVVLQTGIATITMKDSADVSNEVLMKTVKDAGFEAARIERNFESEYPDVGTEKPAPEPARAFLVALSRARTPAWPVTPLAST